MLSLLISVACFSPGVRHSGTAAVQAHGAYRHCKLCLMADGEKKGFGFRSYEPSEATGMSSPFDFAAIIKGIQKGLDQFGGAQNEEQDSVPGNFL